MYTIAIVGRPNVGKSTLFNRLIGERKAIVDDESGVTRDRQYGECEWNGKKFNIVDTGGYVVNSDDIFEREIRKQVDIALAEAQVILFVVDVNTGITSLDEEFAQHLRRSSKPTLLIVNKVDNNKKRLDVNEFYSLGFEKLFEVSAVGGSGTGDMLDEVCAFLTEDHRPLETTLPKIAIIGQPNSGKSSLLNSLMGEERNIVSDIAGTTRDSIHTHYNLFNKDFILIDTAGLRKKNREKEDLEFYSVIRAVRAIEESDVCMLLIDSQKGISAQDINIFSLAARKGKGLLILMNKWDLIEKDTKTVEKVTAQIKEKIKPFTDVPILFVSATEKLRIHKALEVMLEVFENRTRKIATSKLNEIMLKEIAYFPPPIYRGNSIKIKYISQLPVAVPSFAFFCNYPEEVQASYKNYLENKLRQHFNYSGVPIRLFFRKK
ncbi:MAG: ribosome biogenesis GTPase Der [Chitinophagaceae bacterium]|nr:ribosome biogenesis GTPase Der [Chitinophagaceae bacterium]